MKEPRPIFLLTDFGPGSYYQGVMKGVIASISPRTAIHDLGHGLGQGQLREAGFVLQASLDHLPPNAIVVVVVDPEVGTERRIIALSVGERTVLAPDNGLLTEALDRPDATVVRAIENQEILLANPSATFHGRDVFAPVAAYLSRGVSPENMGALVKQVKAFPVPRPERSEGKLLGCILQVDRFGNLITNIQAQDIFYPDADIVIDVGGHQVQGLASAYQDGASLVAIIGSHGNLEIAAANQNAAKLLGLGVGDEVRVGLVA